MNIVKKIMFMTVCLVLLGVVQAGSEYYYVGHGEPPNGVINWSASGYTTLEACKKWCSDTEGCVAISLNGPEGAWHGHCSVYDSSAKLS